MQAGLSQRELARRAGLHSSYLSRIESGGQKPSAAALAIYEQHCGFSPSPTYEEAASRAAATGLESHRHRRSRTCGYEDWSAVHDALDTRTAVITSLVLTLDVGLEGVLEHAELEWTVVNGRVRPEASESVHLRWRNLGSVQPYVPAVEAVPPPHGTPLRLSTTHRIATEGSPSQTTWSALYPNCKDVTLSSRFIIPTNLRRPPSFYLQPIGTTKIKYFEVRLRQMHRFGSCFVTFTHDAAPNTLLYPPLERCAERLTVNRDLYRSWDVVDDEHIYGVRLLALDETPHIVERAW